MIFAHMNYIMQQIRRWWSSDHGGNFI